jgi:hypothetical protein
MIHRFFSGLPAKRSPEQAAAPRDDPASKRLLNMMMVIIEINSLMLSKWISRLRRRRAQEGIDLLREHPNEVDLVMSK